MYNNYMYLLQYIIYIQVGDVLLWNRTLFTRKERLYKLWKSFRDPIDTYHTFTPKAAVEYEHIVTYS